MGAFRNFLDLVRRENETKLRLKALPRVFFAHNRTVTVERRCTFIFFASLIFDVTESKVVFRKMHATSFVSSFRGVRKMLTMPVESRVMYATIEI